MGALATCLGHPRIGADRELKKALESFWSRKSSREDLEGVARELRRRHWLTMKAAGIDHVPSNDYSLYSRWRVGDVNYGSGEINRHYRAHDDPCRLALHAAAIAFDHPATGVRVALTAPMPDELRLVLARLELPPLSNLPTLWDLPILGPKHNSV